MDAPIPGAVGVVDFSLIGTDADLNAQLQVLERKDMAHIISNPRITTADNKEATILVGKKIPLVIADEAGNAITQLTTIGIKMSVTPHINQDGRITLSSLDLWIAERVKALTGGQQAPVMLKPGQAPNYPLAVRIP